MHLNLGSVYIWQHRLLPLAANVEAGTHGGVIAVRPACAFRLFDLPLTAHGDRGHRITLSYSLHAHPRRTWATPFCPAARGGRNENTI